MQPAKRILTIDVMRGLTLFLMLFVNDLYVPGVPAWLTHSNANFDRMGLADWVFPGFLFMVGMAVPFAVQSRKKKGDSTSQIIKHIIARTLSLLLIGILMLNIGRLNPELTGISKNLWAILMYISVFLIWNQYNSKRQWFAILLRSLGIGGLLALAILFRAGTVDEPGWFITGWWGILGLIGWGYLVTALVYVFSGENLLKSGIWLLIFIGLNILSQIGLLNFVNFLKPVFGVIIDGNTPLIVLAGLFFSLFLRRYGNTQTKKFILFGIVLGILSLILGFGLRNWFIISKIKGTPSWALICNGISMLVFMLLFVVIDVFGKKRWSLVFQPAGQNSLTTYLAPDILYYSIWMSGLPILFYKYSEHALIVVLGSVVWTFLMIGFAALLSKIGIRLKL
jgi:heparan-alpha-glucosaminide N-acetyltransferase